MLLKLFPKPEKEETLSKSSQKNQYYSDTKPEKDITTATKTKLKARLHNQHVIDCVMLSVKYLQVRSRIYQKGPLLPSIQFQSSVKIWFDIGQSTK